MQPRFVLVPAVPVDKESYRVGNRFYAQTVSDGFNIYDNQKKIRLEHRFPNRSLGAEACARMNAETLNPDVVFPFLRTD